MGGACSHPAEEEHEVKHKEKKAYHGQDYVFEGEINFNDEQMQSVVKIQAGMKGCVTRRHMKNGKFFESKLLKEEGLEYKHEVTFEDGTVFKGQVKND